MRLIRKFKDVEFQSEDFSPEHEGRFMILIPLNIPRWNTVLQLLEAYLVIAQEAIFPSVGSLVIMAKC